MHYHADNSYCFLMEKKSLSLQPANKKVLTFKLSFVSEADLFDLECC